MIEILRMIFSGLCSYLSAPKNLVVQFTLLPDDLCQEIVFKFLSLLEVGRMDTAFCSSNRREWFLRILQRYFVNTQYMTRVEEWLWISLRSVRVNKLCLSPQCSNSYENLIVAVNCSEICQVQLFDLRVSESILVSFINQCPKLFYLWINSSDSFTDNVALNISGSILKQLHVFRVKQPQFSKELTCTFISHFAKYCTSLTQCELHITSEYDYISTNDALTELITNNRGLLAILLHFEKVVIADTIIDTIDKCCPQIQRVDINNCDTISFARVSEFVVKRQRQLVCMSLIVKKVNEKRFTFMTNSTGTKCNSKVKKYEILDIRGLDVVSPQCLVEFLTKVTGFERVFFSCMTWFINSDVIAALTKFSPNLRFLLLCRSGGYDLPMFKELFQKCRKLDKLVMIHNNHVTNPQLVEIFSIPNSITALDLSCHTSLTIDTILTILATNPLIRTLRCVSGTKIDPTALQSAIVDSGFQHVTLHSKPLVETISSVEITV